MSFTVDPWAWGVALGVPALFAGSAIARLFTVTELLQQPTSQAPEQAMSTPPLHDPTTPATTTDGALDTAPDRQPSPDDYATCSLPVVLPPWLGSPQTARTTLQ